MTIINDVEPLSMLLERWTPGRRLGCGSFGEVTL